MNINLNDNEANVLTDLLDIVLKRSGLNQLQNVQFFLGKIQEAKMREAQDNADKNLSDKVKKEQEKVAAQKDHDEQLLKDLKGGGAKNYKNDEKRETKK